MWNIKCSNRLLDMKWKKQTQRKHCQSINKMKSQLDTSEPQKFIFLDKRLKAKQIKCCTCEIKIERQKDIDDQNSRLVQNMLNMSSSIKNSQTFLKDSLNCPYQIQLNREIDQRNRKMVKRLQRASSLYSQSEMKKSFHGYKCLKSNLACTKMDPFYDLSLNNRGSTQLSCNNFNKKRSRPYSAFH